MSKQFILSLFSLSCLWLPVQAEVKVEILHGNEIERYSNEISHYSNLLYKEYPYLYHGDDAEYQAYLESYAKIKDAIIVLALEDKKVVGLAAGMPMDQTRNSYKQSLIAQEYSLNEIFYLGEFGLDPKFREGDVQAKMYDQIERFATAKGFKKIAIWEIEPPTKNHPAGYVSREALLGQLGFVRHPELNFTVTWTNIGEAKDSPHLAIFWLKNLKP